MNVQQGINMKKCKKCGTPIPLKARKCQFCGKSQGGDTALIAIGIIFAFIVVLAALSLFASDDNTEEISGGNNSNLGNYIDDNKKGISGNNNSNLGNYIVDIVSCRIAEDYQGKPVVIVKYKFTNNSDNAKAFLFAIDANVYQNGIGLNEAVLIDASYDNSNRTKEIKKGATLEVEVAYELNDTKTDIEVEVEESFSLNGNKITKTFSFR